MVMFNNREHTAIPRVDRPVAITIWIEQTNVRKDVQLQVTGFENWLVRVNLAKRWTHRIAVEVPAGAWKLMPDKW